MRVKLYSVIAFSLIIFAVICRQADAQPKTYVVNSTAEKSDYDTGDDICSTDAPNGSDTCTFRAAIEQANASVGSDTVYFDIPELDPNCTSGICTITPDSALPAITENLWIDAASQPGADCATKALKIVLDGINAGASTRGIRMVYPASHSYVGGFVIHRFDGDGIFLNDARFTRASCNMVGTDVTGTVDMGNGGTGIYSYFATDNVIGTDGDGVNDAAEGNLVSGNDEWGIRAFGSNNVIIAGNDIGSNLDVTGTIGNTSGGVWLQCSANGVVGTNFDLVSDAFEANVVVGNSDGIAVWCGSDTEENYVVGGNFIGTNKAQTLDLGNTGRGVRINSSNPSLGAFTDGLVKKNTIAYNDGPGIKISTDKVGTVNHRISRNSTYENDGLGIDLGFFAGVTLNDAGDADAGPNNLQNTPILTRAQLSGSTFEIDYFVDSDTANSAFPLTIEVFLADADNEEGRIWLGSDTLTAAEWSACGAAPCVANIVWPPFCTAGDILVATATDSTGNTSEFSAPIELVSDVFKVGALALLQGAWLGPDGVALRTALKSGGYLPYYQPFADVMFDGTSLDFDSLQSAPLPSNAVDWVLVSLRTGLDAASEVPGTKHAAWIDYNGSIRTPGVDSLMFAGVVGGPYYLVVQPRNHLGVITSSTMPYTGQRASWNFASGADKAYGTNPMIDVFSGLTWALYAGDADGDGLVTAPDFNAWNAATSAGATGYEPSDFNMDGDVTAPDFNLWNANTSAGAASQVPD